MEFCINGVTILAFPIGFQSPTVKRSKLLIFKRFLSSQKTSPMTEELLDDKDWQTLEWVAAIAEWGRGDTHGAVTTYLPKSKQICL